MISCLGGLGQQSLFCEACPCRLLLPGWQLTTYCLCQDDLSFGHSGESWLRTACQAGAQRPGAGEDGALPTGGVWLWQLRLWTGLKGGYIRVGVLSLSSCSEAHGDPTPPRTVHPEPWWRPRASAWAPTQEHPLGAAGPPGSGLPTLHGVLASVTLSSEG